MCEVEVERWFRPARTGVITYKTEYITYKTEHTTDRTEYNTYKTQYITYKTEYITYKTEYITYKTEYMKHRGGGNTRAWGRSRALIWPRTSLSPVHSRTLNDVKH